MTIKNIIFDLGAVLCGLDGQRCIDAFRKIGCGEVASYVEEHRTEDLFLDTELGRISTHDFCDEVRRLCSCTATDDEIVWAWNELLTGIPEHKLQLLARLRGHYRLFLLSNTNFMHWNRCADEFFAWHGHGAEWFFENIHLSCAMHLAKPGTEIFAEVLRQNGLNAEETLFIDDSADNCRAAEKLGITALHETTGELWTCDERIFAPLSQPCVATIGFFDGVHRGHRFLIEQVKRLARESGMQSTVVTFDLHPRQVLQADYVPQLLSTPKTKRRMLRATGVDNVEVLHFDREMAQMTARDFMQKVLGTHFGVKKLVIGYDNRFGHNREEGFDDYVRYGRELGIEVLRCDEAQGPDGRHVSSSAVRRLLAEGDVAAANACLGYDYAITGHVAHGYGEGRKLGFPTANVDTTGFPLLIPASGVYAAMVWVEDEYGTDDHTSDPSRLGDEGLWRPAMVNIGTRPTFGDGTATTIEAHIMGFSADIYGRLIRVAFKFHIRAEQKFPSPEALASQLRADREAVKQMLMKGHFANEM